MARTRPPGPPAPLRVGHDIDVCHHCSEAWGHRAGAVLCPRCHGPTKPYGAVQSKTRILYLPTSENPGLAPVEPLKKLGRDLPGMRPCLPEGREPDLPHDYDNLASIHPEYA